MDQQVLAHNKQLADTVNQLRRDLTDLKHRITVLEESGTFGPTDLAKQAPTQELERCLRGDTNVQRLLGDPNCNGAAEAAIAYLLHGQECRVSTLETSSTWDQVRAAFECLRAANP
jgi:hypothetical protein